MPERKGRRRRPRDRTRERTVSPPTERPQAVTAASASPRGSRPYVEPRLPSGTARATGFMIGAITGVVAVLMIIDGAGGDHTMVDATLRLGAGVLLVLLAIVVMVLSLAPQFVLRVFGRRAR